VLADQLVRELLTARLVGVLATHDGAGGIHAVPMWFALHDDFVLLGTSARSRKVRCLERDKTATLVVHDSRPGYEVCGASIAGEVEIVRAEEAGPLVSRVHARYVDPAAADDPSVLVYLESDDVALRLTPSAAVTWDERGSDASRSLRSHGWALALVPTEPRP